MITQILKTDEHVYGIRIVVCTNAEVVCDWVDPTGNGNYDEAAEVVSDTEAAIRAAGLDYDTNGCFRDWNGGKYASQAAAFGWWFGCGYVYRLYRAPIVRDENGEPEDTVDYEFEMLPVNKPLPADLEAFVRPILDRIDSVHNEAKARVSREQDEEQAARLAEDGTEFQCEQCGTCFRADAEGQGQNPGGGLIARATCECGGDALELDENGNPK